MAFQKLAVFLGEEGARALLFILDSNDLSIVDEIRKAGVSEDICNFILNLLTKYGERYKEKQTKEYDPFLLAKSDTCLYYVPRTGRIMIGLKLKRTDGETFRFEIEFEEMLNLLLCIFEDMLYSVRDISEKLPFIKFEIPERKINEFIKDLKEFQKYVHAHK